MPKYIFLSITNKMQSYKIRLILQDALHVSGGLSANHQDRRRNTQELAPFFICWVI
jgi:hypothetical protein